MTLTNFPDHKLAPQTDMIPPLFYGVELGKQHPIKYSHFNVLPKKHFSLVGGFEKLPLGQQDDANHKVTQELLLWVFVLLLQL